MHAALQQGIIFLSHTSSWLTFSSEEEEPYFLTGDVIVTKNPCLHPGDIRKLHAVGAKEELAHLVDCIVFPKQGTSEACRLIKIVFNFFQERDQSQTKYLDQI